MFAFVAVGALLWIVYSMATKAPVVSTASQNNFPDVNSTAITAEDGLGKLSPWIGVPAQGGNPLISPATAGGSPFSSAQNSQTLQAFAAVPRANALREVKFGGWEPTGVTLPNSFGPTNGNSSSADQLSKPPVVPGSALSVRAGNYRKV